MNKREIITVILLSIITCGIYQLYWYYVTAEDLNKTDSEEPLMNFILAILLGCITCGIFEIYWLFKFYKKVDKVTNSNNLIINFILSIFGLGLVSTAIAQDQINKSC